VPASISDQKTLRSGAPIGTEVTTATRPLGARDPRVAAGASATTAQTPVDAHEFARLFAAEAPRVWRVLRRLGVPPADVEDVCQEVFLVIYRRWAEFRGESSMRTWIYGIALRKAIGHRRRTHVRKARPLAERDEPAVAPEQCHDLERAWTRQVLQAALDKLGDGKREVFVLYELEQLTMREVAAALELPLHTAYSRLYAARAELRDTLQRLAHKQAWP
jgi:RNA polymerase sigma-70 factor, ECF subfamily